jgi:Trk K+ transport system NAD-binding subunit
VAKGLAGDHAVHHLDDNRAVVAAAVTHEASHTADVAGFAALAGTGVERGDVAVVLTGRDGASLLVAQQLRVRFGLEHVVVGLAEPRNREAFDLPGVTVVPAGDAQVVVDAVRELVPEP